MYGNIYADFLIVIKKFSINTRILSGKIFQRDENFEIL